MKTIQQTRKDFYVDMTKIELDAALADDYIEEGEKKTRYLADGLDFLLTNTAKVLIKNRKSNKKYTKKELNHSKHIFLDLIQEAVRGVFNEKQLPEAGFNDVADDVSKKYLIYLKTAAKYQNRPKAS